MSLFVCMPGFGAPKTDIKWGVLRHNLGILRSTRLWNKIDVMVGTYDDTVICPEDLKEHVTVNYLPKGIIADFMLQFARPDDVMMYDNVIIVLDDVILNGTVDTWATMLKTMETFKIDIGSPAMKSGHMTHWGHMVQDSNTDQARIVDMLECFCYVFRTTSSYHRYFDLLDPENRNIWGIDWILRRDGKLVSAIFDNMVMEHIFFNPSNDDVTDQRYRDAIKYLEKRGYDWSSLIAQGVSYAIVPLTH